MREWYDSPAADLQLERRNLPPPPRRLLARHALRAIELAEIDARQAETERIIEQQRSAQRDIEVVLTEDSIITNDQLKQIRQQYNLTKVQLSRILGSLLESGIAMYIGGGYMRKPSEADVRSRLAQR